jgi:hypothetical protein
LRTRNKTDELVEIFLQELGDDIHDMFCSIDADNYRGLDSDRDTEEEVETALRFFPNVLTRRIQIHDADVDADADGEDVYLYPIQLLAFTLRYEVGIMCNMKALSFIPLLARLAIELGLFEEERGGLL